MRLTREIRLGAMSGEGRARSPDPHDCATAGRSADSSAQSQRIKPRYEPVGLQNTWAGNGGEDATEAFWILRATARGPVDAKTGYLCNIRVIDAWLRGPVLNAIRTRIDTADAVAPAFAICLADAVRKCAHSSPQPISVETIEWVVSPYTRYFVNINEPNVVSLTRSYEFCASHRLACPGYSDDENRNIFGKCSNQHGHGHNYVVEVTARGKPDEITGLVLPMASLDRIVHERVIEPFDHKNLNVECAEFSALNPSVENIARVIFKRLHSSLGNAQLAKVQVWETPKTSATCDAVCA